MPGSGSSKGSGTKAGEPRRFDWMRLAATQHSSQYAVYRFFSSTAAGTQERGGSLREN